MWGTHAVTMYSTHAEVAMYPLHQATITRAKVNTCQGHSLTGNRGHILDRQSSEGMVLHQRVLWGGGGGGGGGRSKRVKRIYTHYYFSSLDVQASE